MKFELRNVFSLKYHSLLETVFVSVSVFPERIARCYVPRVYFLLSWGLLIQFSPGARLREPLMISG